jgi:hypothetical protein
MSYLDVPRLHFAGTFTANPSTINNNPSNYSSFKPSIGLRPDINLSWNPYGDHAWTINATVLSFVDSSGTVHTAGDPLIGASVQSFAASVPAKLVDLDTEQQGVTRLFGLVLQIASAASGGFTVQGSWDNSGTLINLWFSRVPSAGGDSAAGGAFQSVLEQLVWQNLESSPFLQQLQQASPNGLSVRLSVYGYNDNNASTGFRIGTIVGTIGPYSAGEPKHLVAGRFLIPQGNSPLYYAPAKLDAKRNTLTIDLGNSIQDQAPGGPPANLGTMEAALLGPGGQPTVLGTIDYGPGDEAVFQQTAAVFQLGLTPEQTRQAAGQPIGILLDSNVELTENSSGMYVDVDGWSQYMNPGDQVTVNLWGTRFGAPAAGLQVPLQLTGGGSDNNQPASVLTFPSSVTLGADGSAQAVFQASSPFPSSAMPADRQPIGGQLYFVGGSWASGAATGGAGAPLTVKVFNSIEPPIPNPTWEDVQPILYKYYYLYAIMAGYVDLSNYDTVVANAQGIQHVVSLPFSDPNYMPVTREMSEDQRQLILTWIAQGCPK